jgi:hypothetical protein
MKYHHFPQALLFLILNRYCIHRKKKSFIQKKQGASPKKFLFLFFPWVHRFIPFYSILPKYDSVSSPNIFPWCHICIPYFPQLKHDLVSSPYLLGVAQGDLRQDGAGSEEPQGAQ